MSDMTIFLWFFLISLDSQLAPFGGSFGVPEIKQLKFLVITAGAFIITYF
jgi:hypothetical protein